MLSNHKRDAVICTYESYAKPTSTQRVLKRHELEVCMGVGNPMGIPFPWEWSSHTAHDGNGNGNGNKANGNGNSIYFTRVKIPKITVMH